MSPKIFDMTDKMLKEIMMKIHYLQENQRVSMERLLKDMEIEAKEQYRRIKFIEVRN